MKHTGLTLMHAQNIAIADIVWCMAYKRGVGGEGSYIAQGLSGQPDENIV